ncbi:MAG: hypothetical protein IKW33_01295 [Clostridia bacterium]|nr:hypothetical protein [Clostridia bacterium]
MRDKCAILVCSCDSYEEAWDPFFYLLRKYWPDCNLPVFLNTESKNYSKYGVKTILSHEGKWTARLHRVLEEIDAEFILFFLEDFFFQRSVKTEKFNKVLQEMKTNNQIAVFYFNKITGYTEESRYEEYYLMKPQKDAQYMCNCQAALWRKDVLLEATKGAMSAWEFEDKGFNSLSIEKKGMEYYCSRTTYYDKIRSEDIFSYVLLRGQGYGIWKSRWLWKNNSFLKKEGIPTKVKKIRKMSKMGYLVSKYWSIMKRRLGI